MIRALKTWWLDVTDRLTGKAPTGAKRSSDWPAVRDAHLEEHPRCECCGGKKDLRVHHIEPFHIRPDRELDPANLITLCESGTYGINCHLLVGHLGNWRRWNPVVGFDARRWCRKLHDFWSEAAEEIDRLIEELPDE